MFRSQRSRDSRVMAQFILEAEAELARVPQASPEIDMVAFYDHKEKTDTVLGLKLIAEQMKLDLSARPSRSEKHRANFMNHLGFGVLESRADQYEETPIGRQKLNRVRLGLRFMHDRHTTITDLMDSDPELMAR